MHRRRYGTAAPSSPSPSEVDDPVRGGRRPRPGVPVGLRAARRGRGPGQGVDRKAHKRSSLERGQAANVRSEEHTSELQSHVNLVCRLLLEKKKKTKIKRRPASFCGGPPRYAPLRLHR